MEVKSVNFHEELGWEKPDDEELEKYYSSSDPVEDDKRNILYAVRALHFDSRRDSDDMNELGLQSVYNGADIKFGDGAYCVLVDLKLSPDETIKIGNRKFSGAYVSSARSVKNGMGCVRVAIRAEHCGGDTTPFMFKGRFVGGKNIGKWFLICADNRLHV